MTPCIGALFVLRTMHAMACMTTLGVHGGVHGFTHTWGVDARACVRSFSLCGGRGPARGEV